MNPQRIDSLRTFYRQYLLDDVIPFWLRHGLDHECGGLFTSLDRDGSVYDGDKAMWLQGRAVWLFATLYADLEARPEWLAAARLIYRFLTQYGFDASGRMFFEVTRDGRPLRQRRYLFTEMFATMGCAAYARATQDEEALRLAQATYRLILDYLNPPGKLAPKVFPETRQVKAQGVPMMLLVMTQELRQTDGDANPLYQQVIDRAIDQILNQHARPELRALLEIVGVNGERLDSAEGRRITPGHGLESGWKIMQEGMHRGNANLIRRAADLVAWSMERGWDKEFGGLLYFVDLEGRPSPRIEWDMKLWWPHAEALYALLLAHHLTGEARYAEWYEQVHQWAFTHFADPEYGEWYGYLHRDGTIASRAKGGTWKGPFHLPRALWLAWRLLERMAQNDRSP